MRRLASSATRTLILGGIFLLAGTPLHAADWYVAPDGRGPGTATAPFGRIQDAVNAAQPGDVVHVAPGTYRELVRTVRNGTASQPITLRAASGRGSVLLTMSGRVMTVSHAAFTVEGFVLDGQYGTSDLLRVETGGHRFTLRDSEVRRTSRDAVDIAAPHDVLIEGSLIHHALNAANGRTDAHGIVAGAVRRLTIRNTEIHTFSGDGVQVDPGRAAPGWSDVTIEGCRIWLQPLPAPANGFAAGTVPGENALDTKAAPGLPRAKIAVRDTEAWGYRNGLISNMAAFNMKEHIDAVLDRVTVYDSEIAFRLRGAGANATGAEVLVTNAVVYNTGTAFRYEDNIQNLRVWNVTVGSGVTLPFRAAESGSSVLDVRNFLVLGSSLPAEAAGASNLAVPAPAFVNAKEHDYQLAAGSPAIDRGESIAGVVQDRVGTKRPQGAGFDIGAYERQAAAAPGGSGTTWRSSRGGMVALPRSRPGKQEVRSSRGQDQRSRNQVMPASAVAKRVGIIPALKRKIASVAAVVSASETGSRLPGTGRSIDPPRTATGTTRSNITWTANQMARLRITPTTAAVIAASAPATTRLPRSTSTNGAPTRIQRKHGANVTQVVSSPPRVPATSGESPPGSRYAARNPTNCVTMMSGPGVVSAIPRPSSISPGCSQPCVSTACWAT
jgi:hypothetical protein